MSDLPLPLDQQHCTHRTGPALADDECAHWLSQLPHWQIDDRAPGGRALRRTFQFKDFHHTMAFVNAVAWVAHQEDHHPDMTVAYNRCTLQWSTHSVGGLSMNDFICAARVDALLNPAP